MPAGAKRCIAWNYLQSTKFLPLLVETMKLAHMKLSIAVHRTIAVNEVSITCCLFLALWPYLCILASVRFLGLLDPYHSTLVIKNHESRASLSSQALLYAQWHRQFEKSSSSLSASHCTYSDRFIPRVAAFLTRKPSSPTQTPPVAGVQAHNFSSPRLATAGGIFL